MTAAAWFPDERPHYAVKVINLPPTKIVCKCGLAFDGADPIGQLMAHMDELNPEDAAP